MTILRLMIHQEFAISLLLSALKNIKRNSFVQRDIQAYLLICFYFKKLQTHLTLFQFNNLLISKQFCLEDTYAHGSGVSGTTKLFLQRVNKSVHFVLCGWIYIYISMEYSPRFLISKWAIDILYKLLNHLKGFCVQFVADVVVVMVYVKIFVCLLFRYLWQYVAIYSRTLFWNSFLSLRYRSAASLFSGSSKFSKSCWEID